MDELIAENLEEARKLAYSKIRSDVHIIEAENKSHWFFLVEGRYCGASVKKRSEDKEKK